MKILSIILISLLIVSCGKVPDGIEPVTGFELEKYTGKWYEIARLDHSFERGLQQVTAQYSINNSGTVHVVNRGFDTSEQQWSEAVGKAKFVGDETVGDLEVSFFMPIYGSYIIFELDKENYQYSFVTGGENTLWLLSRTPTISDQLKQKFIQSAESFGYNTNELIWVEH